MWKGHLHTELPCLILPTAPTAQGPGRQVHFYLAPIESEGHSYPYTTILFKCQTLVFWGFGCGFVFFLNSTSFFSNPINLSLLASDHVSDSGNKANIYHCPLLVLRNCSKIQLYQYLWKRNFCYIFASQFLLPSTVAATFFKYSHLFLHMKSFRIF